MLHPRLIWSDYSGGWLIVQGPGGFTEFACTKHQAEGIAAVLQIPLEEDKREQLPR